MNTKHVAVTTKQNTNKNIYTTQNYVENENELHCSVNMVSPSVDTTEDFNVS